MNLKTISRYVGYALLADALFMLFSVLISLLNGNDSALAALVISFIITFLFGAFPFIFVRNTSRITLREGYLIVVLSWLLSFVFGMLPYALWGGPFTIENAWFESVSGFTTTGATILERVESLPDSLLFWRSSTHFIGGLGVVVFLLLIIPDSSPIRMRLTNMELSSLSKDGYNSRASKTVFIFAYVYLGLNLLAFLAYWAAGMSPFDAINHAFSVCATGGFSTHSSSIAYYDSTVVEAVTMVFMIAASLHFGLVFLAIVEHSVKPLNNPVVKFYLLMIAVVTVGAGLGLAVSGPETSFGKALWDAAFQTVSLSSTTGFAISDNASWPLSVNVLILFSSLVAGCAGSTTGGLRSDRVLLLFKTIGNRVRQTLNPSLVSSVRVGSRYVRTEEAAPHVTYVALFVLLTLLSIFVAFMTGADANDAVTGSIATISNVGQAMGSIGSMGNFNALPASTKILFSINMFLGRVEVYPVLAVLAMAFSRNRK